MIRTPLHAIVCMTHHRPLWIASSQTKPTKDAIALAEGTYGTMVDESVRPPFPKSYPTGCLLGRVQLGECLTAEEYVAGSRWRGRGRGCGCGCGCAHLQVRQG